METWDALTARRNVRQYRPVSYLIGAGYPADRPLRPIALPDRRPFAEVVHRGVWGAP